MTSPTGAPDLKALDIEGLKALCEKATPGPWTAESGGGRGAWIAGADRTWAALSCGKTDEQAAANANFIAAFNPSTALALLARAEAAEQENAKLKEAAERLLRPLDKSGTLIAAFRAALQTEAPDHA